MSLTQLLTEIGASPAVYRVGWALVHSLWLGAAVAAVLAAALVMLRRRSANARYLAGGIALAMTVVLVLGAFVVVQPRVEPVVGQDSVQAIPISLEPSIRKARSSPNVTHGQEDASTARSDGLALSPKASTPAPADPAPSASRGITPTNNENTARAWTARVSSALEPALPWLVAAWSAGVCVLLVWHLGGWLAVGRLRRQAIELTDSGLIEMAARLKRTLRVSRPVRLLESALVRVPTVAGWLRPAILLPVSLATGLTSEQIEAILAHELAHIRRWDYLVNLLQSLIETLLFYHPAVWWMSHRIRAERENACDDLAVAIGQERATYAESLARTAEMACSVGHGMGVLSRVTVGAAGRSSGLRDRIFRLLDGDNESRVRFPGSWPGALATAAAILCLGMLMIQAAAEPPTPQKAAITLRLSLSADSGQVVFVNNGAKSCELYRDALSLAASGKTEEIPRFPKPFPTEKPVELKPGASLSWPLVVKGNKLYPYTVDRGGIRLLEKQHKVRAVYQHPVVGKMESNEVAYPPDSGLEAPIGQNNAWSETVKGLQYRLYLAPHDPETTRPIDTLTFEVRNVSDKPIEIDTFNGKTPCLSVRITGYRELRTPPVFDKVRQEPFALQPGKTWTCKIADGYHVAYGRYGHGDAGEDGWVKFDPAGKTYEISLNMSSRTTNGVPLTARLALPARPKPAVYWPPTGEPAPLSTAWSQPTEEGLQTHIAAHARTFALGDSIPMRVELRHKDKTKPWGIATHAAGYQGAITVSNAAGKQVGRRPASLHFNTFLGKAESRVMALLDLSHTEYGIDKPGQYSVRFDGVPKKPNLVALPASASFAFEVRPAAGKRSSTQPDKVLRFLQGREPRQYKIKQIEMQAGQSDLIVLGTVTAIQDYRARDGGMSYDVKVGKVLKDKVAREALHFQAAGTTLHFRSAGNIGYAEYKKGDTVLLFLYYWGDLQIELLQHKPVIYLEEQDRPAVVVGDGAGFWEVDCCVKALARAAERAGKLRADLKKLRLELHCYGPQQESAPREHFSLVLTADGVTASGMDPNGKVTTRNGLSPDITARIVDHLDAEGFLSSAANATPAGPDLSPVMACVLTVAGPDGLRLEEVLGGYDLRKLRRLRRLQELLDGDAAKGMDRLLQQWQARCTEWMRQLSRPTTKPASPADQPGNALWSQPVNGLRAGIATSGLMTPSSGLKVNVFVQNLSNRAQAEETWGTAVAGLQTRLVAALDGGRMLLKDTEMFLKLRNVSGTETALDRVGDIWKFVTIKKEDMTDVPGLKPSGPAAESIRLKPGEWTEVATARLSDIADLKPGTYALQWRVPAGKAPTTQRVPPPSNVLHLKVARRPDGRLVVTELPAPAKASKGNHPSDPSATQPAVLDLAAAAKLLTEKVGGKWEVTVLTDAERLPMVRGQVRVRAIAAAPVPVMRTALYEVFPFPFTGSNRLKALRHSNSPGLPPMTVLGCNTRCTVLVDRNGASEVSPRVVEALGLSSPPVSLAVLNFRKILGEADVQQTFAMLFAPHGGVARFQPLELAATDYTGRESLDPKAPKPRSIRISAEQAGNMLDYLVDNGLLLADFERGESPSPGCMIVLRWYQGNKWYCGLGWDERTVTHLKSLRARVDGEAGKAMNGLVADVASAMSGNQTPPATQPVGNAGAARASVATLLAEAETLRKEPPEQWAQWDQAVADVLAKHAAMVKGWGFHGPPPAPDVAPLKLPVAYLVWHWKDVSTTQRLPAAYELGEMYLRAIADSGDERRIDILLQVLGGSEQGGNLLAKAMTSERVEASIRELLAGTPKLGRDVPLHVLLREFAAALSPELRKAGYDWLRSKWPQGPSNGDGEQYWETLFRLDLDRARREVIPYYGQRYNRTDRYNLYVLRALLAHAGPSEVVANAVRQWRKMPDDWLDSYRRRVLVCADPEGELDNYVADIEAQFKSGQRPDEIPYLVETLVKHIPRQSVKYLRQFANDRRLTGLMGEGVRKRIVRWLVEQKDEQAEGIVARWLAEEDKYAQSHMIDILARQGEFARELLRRIRPDIKLPPLPAEKAPAVRQDSPQATQPAEQGQMHQRTWQRHGASGSYWVRVLADGSEVQHGDEVVRGAHSGTYTCTWRNGKPWTGTLVFNLDMRDMEFELFNEGRRVDGEGRPLNGVHYVWVGGNRKPKYFQDGVEPAAMAGIEWVDLKAGKIELGPPDHRRVAELKRSIRVSAGPITCSQYARFLAATNRKPPVIPKNEPVFQKLAELFQWEGARPSKEYEDWPVALVSFDDANAYCQWLTEASEQAHRLPTKVELEYALGDAWYKNRQKKWIGNVAWWGLGPVGGPDKVLSKVGLQCFPDALSEWTSAGNWVGDGVGGHTAREGETYRCAMKAPGRKLRVYGFRVVAEPGADLLSSPAPHAASRPTSPAPISLDDLRKRLEAHVGGEWKQYARLPPCLRGLIELKPGSSPAKNTIYLVFPWSGDASGRAKAKGRVNAWARPLDVIWSNDHWTVLGDTMGALTDPQITALTKVVVNELKRVRPAPDAPPAATAASPR